MERIELIKINQSLIGVRADDGICMELSLAFSFYVDGYKFMPAYKNGLWDGKIRLFDARTKTIPQGLYKDVIEFANKHGYQVDLIEHPEYGVPGETYKFDPGFIDEIPLTSKGKKIEARPYQRDAVCDALHNKSRLLLSPTASGKSLMIYLMIRHYLDNFDGDVLLVVPTTSLVEQMYGDFADYSEYDDSWDVEESCHTIIGGRSKSTDKRVVISTWQSIYKQPKNWFARYGMVLGDEAHGFKAKSLNTIMMGCSNAEFRIGTTGTLDGTLTGELQLKGLFGPVRQATTTRDMMDRGDSAELKIEMLNLKYPEDEAKMMRGQKYQTEIDFIVQHPKRNNLITNLALNLKGNTLVLFNLVDKHGKPLYEKIKEKVVPDRKVFFVHGGVGVDDREGIRHIVEKEKDAIIVASLGTFSTGVNIKNLHNIIFASPSKSQIKVLQSIGRGLRKSDDGRHTTLYDLVDDLSINKHRNYTFNHGAHRLKIYVEQKFDFDLRKVKL